MDRVGPFDTSTLTVPYGSLAAWQNAAPGSGIEGSVPSVEAWIHAIEEIVYCIEQSGQTPDHTNLHQLKQAIVNLSSSTGQTVIAQTPVGKGLFSKQVAGSYTWTVPAGVYWVYATCVGAGAGGSGTSTAGTQAGAGGGGGGAAAGWIAVTPGQVIPYVVGGASLGVGYAGNSGNGGTSSISSIMQATGGRGVSNNGNAGGAGGVGTGGQLNIAGGCGNDAPVGTANYPGGFGGSSLLGGGGRTGVIGVDGVAPGTGGGGGYTTQFTQNGGKGADGYVSFQY
jgi:hypothetical protein